jgi:PAS domain S-box-containing protein
MNNKTLRVIIVEDSEDDALLLIRALKKGGYNPVYERVDTAEAMGKSLKDKRWDIILCDYKMPDFSAPSAISLLKKTNIDIPVIIISGAIGEETAVECMRLGVRDYITKANLSRLCPAIARELEDAEVRNKEKQTESQRDVALELLRQSEKYFKEITENSSDIIIITDKNGDIKYCSLSIERYTGYKPEELIGKSTLTIIHPDDKKRAAADYGKAILKADSAIPNSFRIVCKDGSERCFEGLGKNLLNNPDVAGFIMNVRDITERKKAGKELLESEERLRKEQQFSQLLLDASPAYIVVIGSDGKTLMMNRSLLDALEYTQEEIREIDYMTTFVPEEDRVRLAGVFQEIIREGKSNVNENRIISRSGRIYLVEWHGQPVIRQGRDTDIFVGVGIDITDRRRVEDAQRESEKKYRDLYDFLPIPVYEIDLEANIISANRAIYEKFGCAEEDIKKGFKAWQILTPEDIEKSSKNVQKLLDGAPVTSTEYPLKKLDGSEFPAIVISSLSYINGKPVGLRGAIIDITDRKQAEVALKESEIRYRLLADNVHDVIFVLDMNMNYTYVSPSVKILWGYEPTEVLKQNAFETLTPSSWELAVRTLSEVMELEKSEHRDMNIFRTLQLETIRKDRTVVWTEAQVSFVRDENQRPVGILGVFRDITERRKADDELQQTLESLRKAVGTTIHVLISALEARDPYTAGHQSRVSDLARAIATEMGIGQDKIEGIRMAGSIHDIGKLSIPSEILSKPTKLTNLEFSLIKEHAQSGYEILKNVESSWPLAEIVYQHHERMDGSGYPRNLKGDEILLEARIMAVADVVEAMASHRPYRPGLGIKAALEEIEKNKGVIYDDTVADACLKLFREKGYQLP